MSDDGEDLCTLLLCGLVLTVIAFIFMTVASPGFLLYGFFSAEWLIDNSTSLSTTEGDNKIFYGLYKKCQNGNCSSYGKLIF